MRRIYNKFLIVFVVFMVFGFIYLYFSESITSEAALSSSLVSNQTSQVFDDKINSDIAFISTLSSLENIKIDTSLFSNNKFKSLKDNTVKLDSVISGRINPFAPIGNDYMGNVANMKTITTNQPAEIKDNSAILSGLIGDPGLSSFGYFEYGPTDQLGKTTETVDTSLIGNFVLDVVGLNSKTTYFYKACSRIVSQTVCGNVVSFKTN